MLLRSGALAWALLGAAAAPRAQAADADPAQPQALGHVFAAGPGDGQRSVYLLSAASYGYTESVLGEGDTHHRMAGALDVEGRPVPWLGLAFRVDGRYDLHILPGQPSDNGLVGDPRVYARVDRALGESLRAGVRAGLWLPGRNAPSIDWSALSPELVGALSWVPPTGVLSLSANAGYRLDRSANSATDAPFLSASDRLALEVSAFDQVLLGVAATLGRGRTQGFVEGSWDILVGRGAPSAAASPIHLGGGARVLIGERVRLEAEADVSPSARPELGPNAPLVPVPPRVTVAIGLGYRFGDRAPPPRPASEAPPPGAGATVPELPPHAGAKGAAAVAAEEAAQPLLPAGQVRGLVRSFKGAALDAEVRIDPLGRVLHADKGAFRLDVAPGSYEITVSMPGYETQTRRVQVEQNGVTLLNVDLRPAR